MSPHRTGGAGSSAGGGAEDRGVLPLLEAMRTGDRTAAAEFITRYGSRVRRRICGKLSPAMRRLYDSQDILSTLGRRLDQYVGSGRMQAANEDELWALVFRMAENTVIDKARVFRRLQKTEGADSRFAQEFSQRLRQAEHKRDSGVEIEIDRALEIFGTDADRQILRLWLVGTKHTAIATHLELTPAAVRKRWQKIKSVLQERFAAEAGR